MISIHTRCDGIFIGHAIASYFDGSVQIAQQLSGSLLELKSFDRSDIMSRYLYLSHTERYNYGEIMKSVYENFKDKINNTSSSISRENFLFDQIVIDELVKSIDCRLDGRTAGCGPAHRSFPLALCPWIDDDDLNNTWFTAVQSACSLPCLHDDVIEVFTRYRRWCNPSKETPPAYAPTVLIPVLHYVTTSVNITEAIEKATTNGNSYCLPIVGVLSGTRWRISTDIYKDKANDPQLNAIRATASKLGNLWALQYDNPQS